MTLKTLALTLFFAVAIPIAAQCSDKPAAAANDSSAQVEQRARLYMEALKIQDLQTAYKMYSGALDKTLTAADFWQRINASGSILLEYEITNVSVEDGKGTVQLNATYQYPQLREPLSSPRSLTWILIDGEWYIQSSKPKAPPSSNKPAS
jgi:hypothetical protein